MKTYPVVIHKDQDSDFGVTVPDIPGCFSAGSTVSEALNNAVEAISGHIECLVKDGEPIPEAAELEEYINDPKYSNAYLKTVVSVDLTKISTEIERVNITLPKWLISAIDRTEPNRSRFLAESAIKQLSNQSN